MTGFRLSLSPLLLQLRDLLFQHAAEDIVGRERKGRKENWGAVEDEPNAERASERASA